MEDESTTIDEPLQVGDQDEDVIVDVSDVIDVPRQVGDQEHLSSFGVARPLLNQKRHSPKCSLLNVQLIH
jgi:hypothetical protein